ncbi:hypothetical protein JOF53_001999 [Crossiella equi]|uniref:DUF3592 domain-containing protein n=1 Tax=Crossiella equi TaxID=130796 RepID=A0ABS5AA21_9PSEU|nr:hypothetical protein [Crossiella equi]MBP2473127.1 hypothetical protein [Crossiella equi]
MSREPGLGYRSVVFGLVGVLLIGIPSIMLVLAYSFRIGADPGAGRGRTGTAEIIECHRDPLSLWINHRCRAAVSLPAVPGRPASHREVNMGAVRSLSGRVAVVERDSGARGTRWEVVPADHPTSQGGGFLVDLWVLAIGLTLASVVGGMWLDYRISKRSVSRAAGSG